MIPAGYKLKAIYSGVGQATPDAGQLSNESRKCDAVILSVWAVENDAADTIKPAAIAPLDDGRAEIYYGLGEPVHPVYPAGASETTDLFWVGNAQDVVIRANKQQADSVFVGYTLFKLVPIEEKQ